MTSIPNTRYEIWPHISHDFVLFDADTFYAVYVHVNGDTLIEGKI